MNQIPDAPWIRNAELNGVGDPPVYCPCCGEDCVSVFKDRNGDVFACDRCIQEEDSLEWMEEEKERSRPDWADEE